MASQVPDDLIALEAELAELGDAPMDAFEDVQEELKPSDEVAEPEAAAAELSKASSETKLATIAEEEEEVQGDKMNTDQEEPKPTTEAADEPAAEEEEDAAATESAPAEDAAAAATAAATAARKKKPAFAAKKKPLEVAKAAPAVEKEAGNADAAAAPAAAEPAKKKAAAAKPKPAVAKKGLAVAKAPTKPAAAKAVPKAKAAAAQPDSAATAAAAATIKRAKPAYFFFCEERRAQIKETDPELTFGEVGSKLGGAWKELSEVEKAPFNARAEADKQRYKEEVEAAGPEAAAAAAAAKKAKKEKPKAATVTAYKLYCEDMRSALQAENPNAGVKEVEKLLAAGWKEATPEDKAGYESAAKEVKAEKRSAAAAAAPSKKRSKKSAKASAADEAEEAAGEEAAAMAEEEEDDEQERMACDWEAHPAVAIISETKTGKYLVLREGLGFEQYGLVDAKAAKLQRLGESSTSKPLPVTLAMIEDYEASVKAFKRAVHDRQDCGELDLEDLPAGSALEACFFFGRLREPGYALHRKDKDDIDMKVPMLATCRNMQRMLDLQRQATARATQRAVLAEGRLADFEGKAGAAGTAVEA